MDVILVSVFYRRLPSVAFPRTRAGKRPWAGRSRGRGRVHPGRHSACQRAWVGCAPRRACERRAAAAGWQVALAAAKFARLWILDSSSSHRSLDRSETSSAGNAPPLHSRILGHVGRSSFSSRRRACGTREAACARSPAHPVSDPSGAHRPCRRAREHSPPAKARATEGRPPWRLTSPSTRQRTPRRCASGSTTTTGAGCWISSGPRRRGVSGHASSPLQTHHQP